MAQRVAPALVIKRDRADRTPLPARVCRSSNPPQRERGAGQHLRVTNRAAFLSEMLHLNSSLAFGLWSCGVAECVGDAVEQRWSEFLHLWRDLGREETLFPPDLAADSGER